MAEKTRRTAKSKTAAKAQPKARTKTAAAPKTKTVDHYLEPFPDEVKGRLQLIRLKVKEMVPDAKEEISYGIPTFKLNDRYLIYFGGWKNYISMYPLPEGNPEFEEAVAPYRAAKSTVRFAHKQPLPLSLIETIVRLALAESTARAR